jgi:hypothetical protein
MVHTYFNSPGRTQGKAAALQPTTPSPPPKKNPNVKDTCFLDTILSNNRRDLPFSRHQPLKSADD